MDKLNIAENIVRLRREKKMTQEQLAEFIGVTKASVSKWETGQSMPDIMILPQLASFFDVTVDALLGYVPQLSKEQIRRRYQEFATRFANDSFEEVMAEIQEDVKKYYSCYPFLFQICVLLLNHYTLAEEVQRKNEILVFIVDLCEHIKENCRDIRIADDIVVLQAMVHLQLGRTQEVVDALEEMAKPDRLMGQSGIVLMQAYAMAGDSHKAESFMQISMYQALFSLIGTAVRYIAVHVDHLEACEPTINRIEQVEETYALCRLNPNQVAVFEYQAAVCYALHGEKEKALTHLEKYVLCLRELFAMDIIRLHGDDYFNEIEEWFEQTEGGADAPRDRQLVLEDVRQSFDNPALVILQGEAGFQELKERLGKIQ